MIGAIIILLIQDTEFLWVPELSVRTELLSELSPGIVPDDLTNIFLNPAYSGKVTKNKICINHQGRQWGFPYLDPYIRGVCLTEWGISGYVKVKFPSYVDKIATLPADMKIGGAYSFIKQQGDNSNCFGIGYLYGFENKSSYRGIAIDSQTTHSFSMGMTFGERVNGTISVSNSRGRVSYSPGIKKTVVNTGIGVNTKIINYFFASFTSLEDTCSHYSIDVFDKVGKLIIDNEDTKIYAIGELECVYWHILPSFITPAEEEYRTMFKCGISFEKQLSKFSIAGNFSEYVGYCTNNSFVFLSDDPVCLGMSIKASPLELWIRTSPYIYSPRYWSIELLYVLN